MSWLSQFVKHNRDFAGNLLKNVSPAAFLIPGIGPLAAAGLGAAGSALGRGIQHGGNLGNILKQGAIGGAIAGGGALMTGGDGHALANLRSAFSPSSSAAGSVAAPTPGVGAAGTASGSAASAAPVSVGGITAPAPAAAAMPTVSAPATTAAQRFGWMAGDALKGVGSFAKANPTAMAMGLQGVGQLGQMGSENAYKRAQARLLDQQGDMNAQELEMLKRRQAALLPLLQALQGQQSSVAKNPYV